MTEQETKQGTPFVDPPMAEQHSHHDSQFAVIDPDVIKARQDLIRKDAPCVGCGASQADCEAQRGKDPTAPPWFGCCARGPALAPCHHVADVGAMGALVDEIWSGHVRTTEEILAERTERKARAAQRRGPLTGSIFDQGEWWRQRDGSFIRIAEMTPGHRYNSAALLMRAAPVHAFRYAWGFAGEVERYDGGDMAHASLERLFDEVNEKATADPQGWLRSTTLYQALTAGLTITGDGTQPWQATGCDPVTGEKTEVPPPMVRVCEIPACGCSGEAHA